MLGPRPQGGADERQVLHLLPPLLARIWALEICCSFEGRKNLHSWGGCCFGRVVSVAGVFGVGGWAGALVVGFQRLLGC